MRRIVDNALAPYVALVALTVVWGYNWVVMKVAVHDASPLVFAAWRTVGGACALALGALVARKSLRTPHLAVYAWIGVFQTGVFLALVTWAIVSAGAGTVAMLSYTMPLWVALIAWPALGERLGVVQGVAIAIAFAGIACMIGPLHGALPSMMALLAGLVWAIGVILTKRVQRESRVDSYSLTTWQMLAGGAVLLAAALLVPERATEWTPALLLAIGYNIVLATAIAYVLWTFILEKLAARMASMSTLLTPVFGTLAAWVALHETPPAVELAGMALVIAGLALLTFADRKVSGAPVEASSPQRRDSKGP